MLGPKAGEDIIIIIIIIIIAIYSVVNQCGFYTHNTALSSL